MKYCRHLQAYRPLLPHEEIFISKPLQYVHVFSPGIFTEEGISVTTRVKLLKVIKKEETDEKVESQVEEDSKPPATSSAGSTN